MACKATALLDSQEATDYQGRLRESRRISPSLACLGNHRNGSRLPKSSRVGLSDRLGLDGRIGSLFCLRRCSHLYLRSKAAARATFTANKKSRPSRTGRPAHPWSLPEHIVPSSRTSLFGVGLARQAFTERDPAGALTLASSAERALGTAATTRSLLVGQDQAAFEASVFAGVDSVADGRVERLPGPNQ